MDENKVTSPRPNHKFSSLWPYVEKKNVKETSAV